MTGRIARPAPGSPPPVHRPSGGRLAALSLAALGVVYGDIGTSPLYAIRECFKPEYGLAPDVATVYGLLSLIVWALIIVVTVKYVALMLLLDNRGEGGILALLALVQRTLRETDSRFGPRLLIALGLFGAALLYGDGIITPAISVLSATEGLEVATPVFQPFVLPATALILLVLFLLQKHGTAGVGSIFGPIMAIWFATIGALGAIEIAHHPGILRAVFPWHGIRFVAENGAAGFLVLGAVVLVITGAEALYADLGHFGRRPIRVAWFTVVLPALLLNYFGQGALLLRAPDAVRNPFYRLAPDWFLYPLVVLATVATVVASQALISGAFSLTYQAVQLRFVPRVTIVHTSRREAGQIYVPEVNRALMIGCLLLVLGFQSSGRLAAAYGIAVTGTMAITTVLFYAMARRRWQWPLPAAAAMAGAFLAIDLTFFSANMIKVEHGGWVPLALAAGVFSLMTTWKRGTTLVNRLLAERSAPLERFLAELDQLKPPRVPGTAVFLTPNLEGAPLVLLHHLRHNKVLHEEVVLLSVVTREIPDVPDDERLTVEPLPAGFIRVKAFYGFMQSPDVQDIVRRCCAEHGIRGPEPDVTYYLGRAGILPTGKAPMMRWRKWLFAFMSRNASSATDFFRIPPDRVMELGARIEL